MPCPIEKDYERRSVGADLRCVYKPDPNYFVRLIPLGIVLHRPELDPLTLEKVKTLNVSQYTSFVRERDRFVGELAIIDGKISREKKLTDAFKRLQDAENVRDKSPEVYRQARVAYYTLKDGDRWLQGERERILKSEVEPKAQSFLETQKRAFGQFLNQRKTIDVVNGLKDRVLSIKDELKYSADTFKDQLEKVQDAINRENRTREPVKETSLYDWLDTILNILILSSLVYVVYTLARKFWVNRPAPTPSRVATV